MGAQGNRRTLGASFEGTMSLRAIYVVGIVHRDSSELRTENRGCAQNRVSQENSYLCSNRVAT